MSNKRKPKKVNKVRAHIDGNIVFLETLKGNAIGAVPAEHFSINYDGVVAVDDSQLRRPGIDGTFRGACVGCLRSTDTCVALDGQGEFIMALLERMGFSKNTAEVFVKNYAAEEYGSHEGQIPMHDIFIAMQVCSECANKIGVRVARVSGARFTTYRQRNWSGPLA